MLVICGAVIFACKRRFCSEPISKSSSPEPVYEVVQNCNIGKSDANDVELCSFTNNIKTGDEVVGMPNDKPFTKRDNRSFSNTKAEPNQYKFE